MTASCSIGFLQVTSNGETCLQQSIRIVWYCCQVVALVFEHVDIERSKQDALCMATPRSPSSPGARSARSQAGSDTLHSPGSGALIEHGPANAALKLLDNLCMMLTGLQHAPQPSTFFLEESIALLETA